LAGLEIDLELPERKKCFKERKALSSRNGDNPPPGYWQKARFVQLNTGVNEALVLFAVRNTGRE
jgi:hypothetical protein